MKLVSGIVDSGFFAQSALSAEVATKDSLGRNISETYLTGVDLTPYQTTAGMTAYQSAGDYYSASNPSGFLVADDITGKLDASVYAADSGNFLTAVPVGTMNESAFEYDENDKISGYNGSAFAGGSDVPEGVMVESGLEYNAVNEISAYNGSAIAQYGAEKQFIVHDDTLVHLSNSAQYALGVNLSAVAQLLGVDETVLYEAPTSAGVLTANLSEPLSSFKTIEVYSNRKNAGALNLLGYTKFNTDYKPEFISITGNTKAGTNETYLIYELFNVSQNALTFVSGTNLQCIGTSAIKVLESPSFANAGITKVIGIGRKA